MTLMTCGGPAALVGLSLAQIARRTHDRFRDLTPALRDEVAQWLNQHSATDDLVRLVTEGGEFTHESTGQLLGDQLPPGLSMMA